MWYLSFLLYCLLINFTLYSIKTLHSLIYRNSLLRYLNINISILKEKKKKVYCNSPKWFIQSYLLLLVQVHKTNYTTDKTKTVNTGI